MIVEITGKCEWEGCKAEATTIACGRELFGEEPGHPKPACYCDVHANVVELERDPEYTDNCPNCGCRFGVN